MILMIKEDEDSEVVHSKYTPYQDEPLDEENAQRRTSRLQYWSRDMRERFHGSYNIQTYVVYL